MSLVETVFMTGKNFGWPFPTKENKYSAVKVEDDNSEDKFQFNEPN
jgi:glucose/arabinose dehydrogenase